MVQKWHFFQIFFLGTIGQENVFYDILERKNAFRGFKNKTFKKSKNWHFFKGVTHGFGPKMAIFPRFFLGNTGKENVFYDILERKNAFRGFKNKTFKKSKNWHFSKGVTHGFGPKMAIFPRFFSGNTGKENVFYDILERKNAFRGYKNKTFKKSKNWDFSKGVNPRFWSKNGYFSIFFLVNIGQENVFYDILQQKSKFLAYKNKKFKKSKNEHFSKRG